MTATRIAPITEAKRGAVLDALENAERAASRLTEEIGTRRDRMECVLSDAIKSPGTPGQQLATNPNKSPLSERIDGHTYVLEALCYQVNMLRQRLEV